VLILREVVMLVSHCFSLRRTFGFAILLTSVLPFCFAHGSTIDITPVTAVVNLTEGNAASDPVTITNNLGVSILVDGYGFSTSIVVSGDPTDGITTTLDFSCDLKTIGPAGTCTFPIPIGTDSPSGETDHDFGTSFISNIFVDFTPTGGMTTRVISASSIQVTVTDVPEPATGLLLATGLTAFLGYGRRRRQRA
jgi:hypothetical protein